MDYEDGRTDKELTLPGGSVDITSKDKVTTFEDDDEYLLQDFSDVPSNGATLTTGEVFNNGSLIWYGWSFAAGTGSIKKGGSFQPYCSGRFYINVFSRR